MQERYFVEAPTGERYGPADLALLQEWAAGGRLNPSTSLIREGTEERIRADALPGLFGSASDGVPPRVGPDPAATGYTPPPGQYAPNAPKKSNTGLIIGIVVGSLCLCSLPILAAIIFPVFAQAKKAATQTKGLSGMKSLATGVLLYAGDYDDHFPPSMSSGSAILPTVGPYVKDPIVFKSQNPAGGEILGDPRLNGRQIANLVNPAETIMLHDSLPWERDRTPVARADGSAKMVPFASIPPLTAIDPFGGLTPQEERRQEAKGRL